LPLREVLVSQFVTDINVLVAYDDPVPTPPIHVPAGWEWIDVDLNAGARGSYLYFVFERCAQDRPITGIRVVKDDERPPAGYQKLPVNLNKGTVHGKALFLALSRKEGRPIADLAVTRWDAKSKEIPPQKGYVRVDADLNLGAGGDFIFLDYLPAAEIEVGPSPVTRNREDA
jgi:hypothetical protein